MRASRREEAVGVLEGRDGIGMEGEIEEVAKGEEGVGGGKGMEDKANAGGMEQVGGRKDRPFW